MRKKIQSGDHGVKYVRSVHKTIAFIYYQYLSMLLFLNNMIIRPDLI